MILLCWRWHTRHNLKLWLSDKVLIQYFYLLAGLIETCSRPLCTQNNQATMLVNLWPLVFPASEKSYVFLSALSFSFGPCLALVWSLGVFEVLVSDRLPSSGHIFESMEWLPPSFDVSIVTCFDASEASLCTGKLSHRWMRTISHMNKYDSVVLWLLAKF